MRKLKWLSPALWLPLFYFSSKTQLERDASKLLESREISRKDINQKAGDELIVHTHTEERDPS